MDLQKTQAQWNAFFKEFTQYMFPAYQMGEIEKRFAFTRVRVLEQYEVNGQLSGWIISGASRGVNCTSGGRLYVDVGDENPSANWASVQVYMDAGKASLVASGQASNGTTCTLNEKNDSGLQGVVTLGTISASNTDLILNLELDEKVKGTTVFQQDTVGRNAIKTFFNLCGTVQSRASDIRSAVKSDIEANFIRTRLTEFLKSGTRTIITATEEEDANTNIQVDFDGLLQELVDAMEDDSIAPQTIQKNNVSVTAAQFDTDNTGSGAFTLISSRESAPTGTVTFTCTSGKDSSLIEEFTVQLVTSAGQVIDADSVLKVGYEWEAANLGIRGKLERTITDVNDGSNQVSAYVANGATLDNTNDGILYQELTDVAGTRTLNWYSDAAKTSLVATGSKVGDGTITMAEQNASGLTGSATVAYTIDDTDMQVLLNGFDEEDAFRVEVTNDEAGRIQTTLRDLWLFAFPSSETPTIKDNLLMEGADHIRAVS